MKKKKSIIFVFTISVLFLLCACTKVNQSTDKTDGITTPTSTPTPTTTPTETPTPTPTPEPKLAVNRENFPDSGFRDYILDHFDKDYDDALSLDEIQDITEITLPQKGIESIEGIQFFPFLEVLDCHGNNITKINLKENKKLRQISCQNNPELTELLYSTSPAVVSFIDCSNTLLTSLETCPSIRELNCNNSRLKALRFESGSSLEILNCVQTSYLTLGTIDIVECKNLRILNASLAGHKLIIENEKLSRMQLNLYGNIKELDLSKCTNLSWLVLTFYCPSESQGGQTLTATNLKNLFLASVSFDMTRTNVSKNEYATADFSGCKSLESLSCYGVRTLKISGCKKIDDLSYDEKITKVIRQ